MKKKSLIIIGVFLLLIAIGLGVYFKFYSKDEKSSETLKSQIEITKVQSEGDELDLTEKDESETNNKITIEKEQSNTNNDDDKTIKDSDDNKSKNNQEIKKTGTVQNNTNNKVENKNEDIVESNKVVENNKVEEKNSVLEEKEEQPIITTNSEYEEMKKIYRYKTSSECYQASLEVIATDTENIKNAVCESGAYKGELVGYKMIIKYNNGTNKIYMTAD